jgi:hypothetical protein
VTRSWSSRSERQRTRAEHSLPVRSTQTLGWRFLQPLAVAALFHPPTIGRQLNSKAERWYHGEGEGRLFSFDVVLRADIPHRRLRPTDQDQKQALGETSKPSPVVLTMRPRCSVIFGSISSARIALSRLRVPSSSVPISREYPATSAASIAARRRVWLMSPRPRPSADRTRTARGAPVFDSKWRSAPRGG